MSKKIKLNGSAWRKIENYGLKKEAKKKILAHRSVEQAANDLAGKWSARLIVTPNHNAGGPHA